MMEECITASQMPGAKCIMTSPIMAPNVSVMEECITASEAKRKYIMTSPIVAPKVSVSVSCRLT